MPHLFTCLSISRCRPAFATFTLGLLVLAAAGCSSETKQMPPSAATPPEDRAGSATPQANAQNPTSGTSAAVAWSSSAHPSHGGSVGYSGGSGGYTVGSGGYRAGSPAFADPRSTVPYGYAQRGYASSVAGANYQYSGSGNAYSGSGRAYYGPSSGMAISGSMAGARPGVLYNQNPSGGAVDPADARLMELERRAAALEQRIQSLLPAVQNAVKNKQ